MKEFCSLILILIVSINLYCQVHWTKHPDNPVMVPGAAGDWDEVIIAPGSVIYHQGLYHMWYWGGDIEKVNQRIGHATSVDGINWSKDVNNPVLEPGPDGTWDGTAVGDPTVIFNDTIFHMWYEGIPEKSLSSGLQIGHATSPDGVIWTKDVNNPVLQVGTSGEWDDVWVSQPEVINNGSEYHMWYTGYNGLGDQIRTGHATSPDGVIWTKDPANPVLSYEAGKWDYPRVDFPKVIFNGNTYQMWYSGGGYVAWDIGYATSEDGSAWKKYANNPVLLNGTTGTWDATFAAFSPVVDSAGIKYKMWYIGGSSTSSSGIGYAESSIFVDIPDTSFLYALIEEGVDTNGDSLISYGEAEMIVNLEVSNKGIIYSTGIEAFINLETLKCTGNLLETLDVSNNTGLTELDCRDNRLIELNVSGNSELRRLDCGYNNLISLDISNNPQLHKISVGAAVHVHPGYWLMEEADTLANKITNIDLSGCPDLECMDFSFTPIESLDLRDFPIHRVCLNYMPFLTQVCYSCIASLEGDGCLSDTARDFNFRLDTTGSPNVYFTTECTPLFYLDDNGVTIKCENCQPGDTGTVNGILYEAVDRELLEQKRDEGADLTVLCTSLVTEMDSLFFWALNIYGDISSWDVSNVTDMRYMFKMTVVDDDLIFWDVSNVINMDGMFAGSGYNYDLSGWCVTNITSDPGWDVNWDISSEEFLPIWGTCPAQDSIIVSIPDIAFLFALIDEGVDTNGDSLISYSEAKAVTVLDVSGDVDNPGKITDMSGIEGFINLESLDCSYNLITSLDVSNITTLFVLSCSDNKLTSLDLSNNTLLRFLSCSDNQLTSLDVTNNTDLVTLFCSGNQLTSLDVSNNTKITIQCFYAVCIIDISNMPSLHQVCVWTTPFPPEHTPIDTTGSPNVYFTTECSGTGIKETNHSELTIYPNPTNNQLTIETDQSDHYSIEITSLNGQQILTGEMEGTTHQLDLSSFAKGVYFITIRSKDFVTTRKIVKL